MKKKNIFVNCIAVGICVLLLLDNLFNVVTNGLYDELGRLSSNVIYLNVRIVMFSIGLIFMNVQLIGGRKKLAIGLLTIFIISGIIGGNFVYDKYNETTSDTDWFGDGID